ncbi:MAG: pyridoxal-phosphate dependent enzyme [Actinobacteria bacterium]|nr:pyridoxal-phosphate dependent enzyme [Actinomycetota bacterium]
MISAKPLSSAPEAVEGNPFVRYRTRLDSYRRWVDAGGSDAEFVTLVEHLNAKVADVDGVGFVVTPISEQPALAEAIGLPSCRLWVKDETNNVSGSHKARHLFGLLLHLAVDERFGDNSAGELAIASCGNAAIGAAVVAKAAGRPLRVFIPTWADANVAESLAELGATVEVVARQPGELGDPTYLRFVEAVANGSTAFSVQGTVAPHALDGGRTIGWELAEQFGYLAKRDQQMARLDYVSIQVGGGALGSAMAMGLADGVEARWLAAMPRIEAVQTAAAAPLKRAWDKLVAVDDPLSALASRPDDFMTPWENVGTSLATGILDDVTYDWRQLAAAMLTTGGSPVVVDEAAIVEAHKVGRATTGINVSATGTSGLAGLLSKSDDAIRGANVAVIFTGVER